MSRRVLAVGVGRALTTALFVVSSARAAWSAEGHEPADESGGVYWDEGHARPFISAAAGVGLMSSLELAVGYGKPHWMWAGVEGSALTTFDFGMVSIGPRIAFVVADLSLKRRLNHAYSHGFLPRQRSYSAEAVEEDRGPIDYGAWDLSLNGLIPTPGGFGLYELAATRVDGVPEDRYLLEEWHRIVVRDDWLYVVRLGWCAQLLHDRLAAGALAEFLTTHERGKTWRLGPLLDYNITDHLSTTLVYTVPVASRDSLGAWTGAWGTLRLRYAFASGEPRWAFP